MYSNDYSQNTGAINLMKEWNEHFQFGLRWDHNKGLMHVFLYILPKHTELSYMLTLCFDGKV